jgi:hypothetical protein
MHPRDICGSGPTARTLQAKVDWEAAEALREKQKEDQALLDFEAKLRMGEPAEEVPLNEKEDAKQEGETTEEKQEKEEAKKAVDNSVRGQLRKLYEVHNPDMLGERFDKLLSKYAGKERALLQVRRLYAINLYNSHHI